MCPSADQVELSANLLTPCHPIDHDVGQTIPPPPPATQTRAVELEVVEPVEGLTGILPLQKHNSSVCADPKLPIYGDV